MTLQYADRVQETTTTTGTGTYTLAGAVAGYQSFAVIGNGNTCYYSITDGTNWEVGLGTYTASGTTLARTSILASSNSNAAVNWGAGTRYIWNDFPAFVAAYLAGGTTGSGAVVLATSPTITSPTIAKLANLTSNGLVTTSSGDGTLGVTVPGTGVLTALAVNVGSAGAFVTFNGALGTPSSGVATNLTGTASGLTAGAATVLATARAIYGNNFDGSAALTQVIASTYGGTGNGFTKFSGPTTSEKTFTLPNASSTLLYDGGALGTPSSGTATNLTGTASGLTAGTATVANGLKSATTTVVVSSATAPSAGQVLTATSSTAADWETPSGGGQPIPTSDTYAVGDAAYLRGTTSVANGSTSAGSNLRAGQWSTTGAWVDTTTQTGTWKNISGGNGNNVIGRWVRTA